VVRLLQSDQGSYFFKKHWLLAGSGVFVKSTQTHGIRKIGVDEILEGVIVSQVSTLEKMLTFISS
jgi:hypothetical protein